MALPRFRKLDPAQQEKILNAARTEFSAHSFAAASLNRILARADLSKGALYYYFDGKEDLFSTTLSHWIETLLDGIGLEIKSVDTANAYWNEATRLIILLAERCQKYPGFTAMVAHGLEAREKGELTPELGAVETRIGRFLAQALALGQSLGALREDLDPQFMQRLIFALARPSDEWLVAAPDMAEARRRAKIVAENYRRLFAPPAVQSAIP